LPPPGRDSSNTQSEFFLSVSSARTHADCRATLPCAGRATRTSRFRPPRSFPPSAATGRRRSDGWFAFDILQKLAESLSMRKTDFPQ